MGHYIRWSLLSVGLLFATAVRSATAEALLLPPALLEAAAQSESTVHLHWDDPNTSETGYAIERRFGTASRFAPIAVLGKDATVYDDGGIAPGTTCQYRVRAVGRKRSYSAYSNIAVTTTAVVSVPPPTSRSLVHGSFGKDASLSGFADIVAAGFDVLDRGAYREYLDALPPGVQAMVWLGDYDNTTCTWEKSDDWIRTHVAAIAGHPAIAAYYLVDEPHVWDCPNAPAELAARSALVKSLDPGPPTLAVIEPHSPGNPYAPYVGTVDVLGVERYPCSYANGCVMTKIDDAIRLADEAGVTRYWAVIQAFADEWYRMPTADELRESFRHWRTSRMEGYLVFSWAYGTDTLDAHPELVDVLAAENAE